MYTNTDVLLSNRRERYQLLEALSSPEASQDLQEEVVTIFCNLLDMASAFDDLRALDYACEIWTTAVKYRSHLQHLSAELESVRSIFVNVFINTRQYDQFERLMAQTSYAVGESKLWSDKLASTLQFRSSEDGHLIYSDTRITRFLRDSNTEREKQQLISTFVKKGVLYSPQDCDDILESFLFYLSLVDNSDYLLYKSSHSRFDVCIELLLKQREHDVHRLISSVRSYFIENRLPHQHFSNMITSLIRVASTSFPHLAVEMFQYKKTPPEAAASTLVNLNHDDLTFVMKAHFNTRNFQQAVMAYNAHPELNHEDQLAVFLHISEKNKDWKLLQEQFEDMYGKGQLPYVIHYSIVMNSLAFLGAVDTVDKLYSQLLKRNLKATASIYGALIKSRVHANKVEEAKQLFEDHLEDISSDSELTVADAYRAILSAYCKTPRIDDTMKFVETSVERQQQTGIEFLDSKSICSVIDYMRGNFAFKEIERMRDIAVELGLLTEEVYAALIKTYTWFGQYALAEKLVFEAHHASKIPLKSPSIYRCQLRNYRFWYRNEANYKSKKFISGRRNFVLDMIEEAKIDSSKSQPLKTELIKYYLIKNQLAKAESYLEAAQHRFNLSEDMYTPFLSHYSRSDLTADHQKNLTLYKQMVEQRVDISMKSYQYIMKSLVFLDEYNGHNYANCEKLMESLFDMNGLSLNSDVPTDKNIAADLEANALYLCRIVSSYVIPRSLHDITYAEILVHFLSQIRSIIDDRVPYQFRFTIYKEMGNLYRRTGNIQSTQSLIKTGLNELRSIIARYIRDYPLDGEPKVPRALQVEVRGLVNVSLKLLNTRGAGPREYLELLQLAEQCQTRLSGDQYHQLIEKVMEIKNFDGVPNILSVIEDHLIGGNYADATYNRVMQYMYKLFILHNLQNAEGRSLLDNYRLYNEYYNVTDIDGLAAELAHVKNARNELETTLKRFNKSYTGHSDFKVNYVLKRPFAFFLPERDIPTHNKLRPYLCNRLWYYLNQYADYDKFKLFKLMDEYPSTIEYLLYNQAHKQRLGRFRAQIDAMIAQPTGEPETGRQRFERTVRALSRLA